MRKTIISFIAIMAFAFSLFFSASPPVAAETGKSFNQSFDVGFTVAVETAQTAQTDFDVGNASIQIVRAFNNPAIEANFTGDIPISVVANSRKSIREILRENYRENYKTKDLVPIIREAKFSNRNDFGGGGFSGINIDTYARAKV